jgi:hypothetical protein
VHAPPGSTTHVPRCAASLQTPPPAQLALEQQTPSTQWALVHALLPLHVLPLGSFAAQCDVESQ